MVLFALCVTGDAPKTELIEYGLSSTILTTMFRILALIDVKSHTKNGTQNGENTSYKDWEETRTTMAVVQRKALDCLVANARAVARHFENDLLDA